MKALLREILTPESRQRLARYRETALRYLNALVAKSSILAWMAYAMSPHFAADFRSFVSGVRKYNRRLTVDGPNISLLRRNLHRIEKGMCHLSRRSSFAVGYILETVEVYAELRRRRDLRARSEIDWGCQVLSSYFQLTHNSDEEYTKAKSIFYRCAETEQISFDERALSYMNRAAQEDSDRLLALLRQRKSIRHYTKAAVPEEVIYTALTAASLSPSSCNRQPYNYYILNCAEAAQEAACVSAGTAGWVEQIQCLAVVVGDCSYFPNAVNRHAIYVDSALSVMPFVLSLEAQGFSTCLINWADSRERRDRMAKLLNLKSYQKVIVSIAIGQADLAALAPTSIKKNQAEIVKDDF